ncbi:MAG: Glycosyl transferase group 1 [candidate division Zixibacteria bacterium RBG-1]|nr:MAG: Glycosyl transferase group 1 [candidate division Zixibacteria bacterium RBG-1]OGC86737.1 MAG: hypothetical protein A2V73_02800 [candidate division Zixibacteria bacterium RBG_19FT_COMBO_42_43]
MKVLYIVSAFPRYEGDIITPWMVETIKRLKSQGVDATVFSPSYKGLKSHQVQGIPVRRFRYFFCKWENLTHEETAPDRVAQGIWPKFLVFFYLWFGSFSIIKFFLKEKFDVIHVHWVVPHFWFGFLARLVSQAPIVSTFYGVELRWVKTKVSALKPFLKWSIKSSDKIIAISQDTYKAVVDLYNREVEIIPYGVSLSEKDWSREKSLAKPRSILFVGRLVERKGARYLIEAFGRIVKDTQAQLVIVGQGPEKEKLQKLAKEKNLDDKIIFAGFVDDESLKNYYQNCSVFVLPAITDEKGDTEGLGVVLIEALSYKKPVVASNVGGITDIVIDKKTGILVPEKNSDELAMALKKILADTNLAKRLGEEGYKYVQEKFGWDRIIKQLKDVYEKAASN